MSSHVVATVLTVPPTLRLTAPRYADAPVPIEVKVEGSFAWCDLVLEDVTGAIHRVGVVAGRALIPCVGLPDGPAVLRATGYDHAGNQTTIAAPVEIIQPIASPLVLSDLDHALEVAGGVYDPDRLYQIGEAIRFDVAISDPDSRTPVDPNTVTVASVTRAGVTQPLPSSVFARIAEGDWRLLWATTGMVAGTYDVVVRVVSGSDVVLISDRFVLQGGPAVPPTDQTVSMTVTAAHTLSGHRIITPRPEGTVEYADATMIATVTGPFWMTLGAAGAGHPTVVLVLGLVVESSWSWTPDQAVYLGASGQMTQVVPTAPAYAYLLRLGVAISPTAILYDPQQPIAFA